MDNKLIKIFATVLEIDESDIGEVFDQSSSPNWDSLNHLNLIIAIEEAYNVSFEPEEIAKMISYKEVESKLNLKLLAS